MKRGGEEKGVGKPCVQDCRQTDRQTTTQIAQVSQTAPSPLAPFRVSPQIGCAHSLLEPQLCLPPTPKEPAPQRGVSVVAVVPEVLLHRALGPRYGTNTAPGAREPGRSDGERPPHSHSLGPELAWPLPSCRMTSRLEGGTRCLSVPGVGGGGTLLGLSSGGRGEGSRV